MKLKKFLVLIGAEDGKEMGEYEVLARTEFEAQLEAKSKLMKELKYKPNVRKRLGTSTLSYMVEEI